MGQEPNIPGQLLQIEHLENGFQLSLFMQAESMLQPLQCNPWARLCKKAYHLQARLARVVNDWTCSVQGCDQNRYSGVRQQSPRSAAVAALVDQGHTGKAQAAFAGTPGQKQQLWVGLVLSWSHPLKQAWPHQCPLRQGASEAHDTSSASMLMQDVAGKSWKQACNQATSMGPVDACTTSLPMPEVCVHAVSSIVRLTQNAVE